jgi:hypothetical protein
MSWRQEALKGVADCEKRGRAVKRALTLRFPSPATSNPWPVEPRLATSRKRDRPSAARNVPERARPPGEKLHQRATAGVVLRSSDVRGRARGSFRLQKSTGGARHRSPTREERADHERCLAILRESKGWRMGPGSRLPRGKARGTVTGSHPIPGMGSGVSPESAESREHLPMEGVSGRHKQSPLTRRRRRRPSACADG